MEVEEGRDELRGEFGGVCLGNRRRERDVARKRCKMSRFFKTPSYTATDSARQVWSSG